MQHRQSDPSNTPPMKNGCITFAVIGVGDLDDLLIEPKPPISAGAEIYEKSISTGR
jgi:hypothetical protein